MKRTNKKSQIFLEVIKDSYVTIDGISQRLTKGNKYPKDGILVEKYPKLFKETNIKGEILIELPEKSQKLETLETLETLPKKAKKLSKAQLAKIEEIQKDRSPENPKKDKNPKKAKSLPKKVKES